MKNAAAASRVSAPGIVPAGKAFARDVRAAPDMSPPPSQHGQRQHCG
jgi:hypothetical protein